MRFVDTNVLLYAVSSLPEESDKRRRALELLRESNLAFSVQVVGEFYSQATRATRPGRLTHDQALAFVGTLLKHEIHPITFDIFRDAADLCDRYKLQYWDALILATARKHDCEAVYSEDMSAQQDYAGLRVINPFH